MSTKNDGNNCYNGAHLYLSHLDYSSDYLRNMWVYTFESGTSDKIVTSNTSEPAISNTILWKVNITENNEYNIIDMRDNSKVSGFNSKLVCTKQYNNENQLTKTYYFNIQKGIIK